MEILVYCRKAEIYDPEENLICEAVVFRDAVERIQLVVPSNFPLDSAETFDVLFYDPLSGLLSCRCTLTSPLKMSSGRISLICNVEEVLETVQRRQDLKVPIYIDVEVRGISSPPGFDLTSQPFPGRTHNISAGGIYFSCELPILTGSVVEIRLTLSGCRPMVLQAKVLRQDELPPKRKKLQFGYGCQFLNLKPQVESELRSFTYRRERQLYYRY